MIKILTGWGNAGGSTTAHINLVNAFNEFGLEAKLYSPHTYHFDKCPSGSLQEVNFSSEDILIFHYLQVPDIKAKKIILSVHEQNLFNLSNVNLSNVDCIHMVSEHQAKYHNVENFNKPYFILSNVMDDLKPNPKNRKKSVGMIVNVQFDKPQEYEIVEINYDKKGIIVKDWRGFDFWDYEFIKRNIL